MTDPGRNQNQYYLPIEAEQEDLHVGHRSNMTETAQAIGACMFCLANLLIVVSALPIGKQPGEDAALLGVMFQGAVLAIWLGAGNSRLWKRGLALAFSYFYFRFYFQSDVEGLIAAACPMGGLVLMVACASAALRWGLHRKTRESASQRFSLRELLGIITALALVLAVWGKPMSKYAFLNSESWKILSVGAVFWQGLFWATAVLVIASPTFVRDPVWRWRSYCASLIVQFVFIIGSGFYGMLRYGYGYSSVVGYTVPPLFLMFVWSYWFYAAESAFELVGVEFAKPLPELAQACEEDRAAMDGVE